MIYRIFFDTSQGGFYGKSNDDYRRVPNGALAQYIKWKVEAENFVAPFQNTVRFNELQRLLGHITTKILTQQLRELEEYGMIKREVYPENPPKVTYSLTELGYTILPVLKALCDWGTAYKNGNP